MAEPCFIVALPIELLQEVGHLLEADSDLIHYARTCQDIHNAIEQDGGSFWRRRFMTVFDKPEFTMADDHAEQNDKYRRLYVLRCTLLQKRFNYSNGKSFREEKSLRILLDMLVQTSPDIDDEYREPSKNLSLVREFIKASNIHQPFFSPNPHKDSGSTKLLLVVQCLLGPDVLFLQSDHVTMGWDETQEAVYATRARRPLLDGPSGIAVSIGLLVHHLHYWKFWLSHDPSQILESGFRDLERFELPQYWDSKLANGKITLGETWRGIYAFLYDDMLYKVRTNPEQSWHYEDSFPGEGTGNPFQDLDLQMVDEKAHFWPAAFDDCFKYLDDQKPLAKNRVQHRTSAAETADTVTARFIGNGSDQDDNFLASGWLKSLPSQMGVPGWQHMTMMKYYRDPDTGVLDSDSLWAYEGIVLPGGKIIVGRWWRAETLDDDEDEYSGPFLLWSSPS